MLLISPPAGSLLGHEVGTGYLQPPGWFSFWDCGASTGHLPPHELWGNSSHSWSVFFWFPSGPKCQHLPASEGLGRRPTQGTSNPFCWFSSCPQDCLRLLPPPEVWGKSPHCSMFGPLNLELVWGQTWLCNEEACLS